MYWQKAELQEWNSQPRNIVSWAQVSVLGLKFAWETARNKKHFYSIFDTIKTSHKHKSYR